MQGSRRWILITGSTDGIGKATAFGLAGAGFGVILHGRDGGRLAAAAQEVAAAAGDPEAVATVQAELGSLASVRALAAEVRGRFPGLEGLINNAGVFAKTMTRTGDGFESSFAINHLAPFLLTHLLLERLQAAPAGRIVNVSSIAHQRGVIELDDLDGPSSFEPYAAYARSKLANVLFTVELARRLAGSTVTVNALHPGVVGTKLLKEGFGAQGRESVEEGAETSVFLASSAAVAGRSGGYYVRCKEAAMAAAAHDSGLCRGFYEASAAACGISGLPG